MDSIESLYSFFNVKTKYLYSVKNGCKDSSLVMLKTKENIDSVVNIGCLNEEIFYFQTASNLTRFKAVFCKIFLALRV